MLYKINGNGIACRFERATKSLYHIIWGGDTVSKSRRPTESFPCYTLKEFRASIERYVRNYIYEKY